MIYRWCYHCNIARQAPCAQTCRAPDPLDPKNWHDTNRGSADEQRV